VLADALIENRLPRHELKADAVIDHGEAAARELGRADKPAADILAGLGGGEVSPPSTAIRSLPTMAAPG